MHDRPLGVRGRNVDHLVIGRGGVFSVNTKNLGGTVVVEKNAFRVNRFPQRYLDVARDEAKRVGERLSGALGAAVEVAPVLVVLTPSLDVREQPEGVHVLGRRDVPRWFQNCPDVLDRPTASRIYTCAREGKVWSAPGRARQIDAS